MGRRLEALPRSLTGSPSAGYSERVWVSPDRLPPGILTGGSFYLGISAYVPDPLAPFIRR